MFSPRKLRSDNSISHDDNPSQSKDPDPLQNITNMLQKLVPDIESIKNDVQHVRDEMKTLTATTNAKVDGIAKEVSILKNENDAMKSVNNTLQTNKSVCHC